MTNHQGPNKSETSSTKEGSTCRKQIEFRAWLVIVIWCLVIPRSVLRLLFPLFVPGIVIHELHPHFAIFELRFIDLQSVHAARAGTGLNDFAVELEAAGVAGAGEAIAVGGVADETARVRADC